MSRSRRKNLYRAITTAESEKQDKRAYHRRFRHAAEQALKADPTGNSVPILREYSDPWGMDKDGKVRFDPVKYPKEMRK